LPLGLTFNQCQRHKIKRQIALFLLIGKSSVTHRSVPRYGNLLAPCPRRAAISTRLIISAPAMAELDAARSSQRYKFLKRHRADQCRPAKSDTMRHIKSYALLRHDSDAAD